MSSKADLIAAAVLDTYDALPSRRKPGVRDNGVHEWVPLSGIVVEDKGTFRCVCLATGMKCLPSSKMSECQGAAIHDWHAEILALRTFNRLMLNEAQRKWEDMPTLKYLDVAVYPGAFNYAPVPSTPFRLRDDLKIHMYCSEAPCGDASMELTMASQEDPTPWDQPSDGSPELPGRGYFTQLGIVRRKPSRGDAPPTLSKSCSDKIALKQCTSLLSAIPSILISPDTAYLDTLVLPASQYSQEACRRAFSAEGRMASLYGAQWHGHYAFKPFAVETTKLEFQYSRRAVQDRAEQISGTSFATTWSLPGVEESLHGGVVQGRKQFELAGASRMSRRRMWSLLREIAASDSERMAEILNAMTYRQLKACTALHPRAMVKYDVYNLALAGWVKNDGDEDFTVLNTR